MVKGAVTHACLLADALGSLLTSLCTNAAHAIAALNHGAVKGMGLNAIGWPKGEGVGWGEEVFMRLQHSVRKRGEASSLCQRVCNAPLRP